MFSIFLVFADQCTIPCPFDLWRRIQTKNILKLSPESLVGGSRAGAGWVVCQKCSSGWQPHKCQENAGKASPCSTKSSIPLLSRHSSACFGWFEFISAEIRVDLNVVVVGFQTLWQESFEKYHPICENY